MAISSPRNAVIFEVIGRLFAGQRHRALVWGSLCYGAGVVSYFTAHNQPPAWLFPVVLGGVLLCAVPLKRRFRIVLVGAAVFFAGAVTAQLRVASLDHPVLIRETGPVDLRGQVIRHTLRDGRGQRIELRRVSYDSMMEDSIADIRPPDRIRLTWRGAPVALRPGQWVQIRAKLMPPRPPATPLDFDYGRYLWFQKIGATGFTLRAPVPIAPLAPTSLMAQGHQELRYLRDRLEQKVSAQLTGAASGLAVALITGNRAGVPEPVVAAFRQSGLAHLLAISGLHLALVVGPTLLLLRYGLAAVSPVARQYPVKKIAAVGALLVAFLYLLIAGAPIPTLRAFIMVAIVLVAVLAERRAVTLRMVALAALVILTLSPEAVLSPSFQLSFAAVTALVACYEALRHQFERPGSRFGKAIHYLFGLVLSSVIATAATAPFVLYHFGHIPLLGLLGNMIAMPLMAIWVMPALLVMVVCVPFGAEGLIGPPVQSAIEFLIAVAHWSAALPLAGWQAGTIPVWSFAAAGLGLLFLCVWQGRGRYLGALLYLGAFATVPLPARPDILISGTGRDWAVITQQGGLFPAPRRANSYQTRRWRAMLGITEQAEAEQGGAGRCDPLGCIIPTQKGIIAVSLRAESLAEDCRNARIVISLQRNRLPCDGPERTIDSWDLRDAGGWAVWLQDKNRHRAVSVAQTRGCWPWSRCQRPPVS